MQIRKKNSLHATLCLRPKVCRLRKGMVIIMWNGKKKAVTFSYDDGVEQDRRLIALFNKYGMKATFNQNSGIQTRADMFIQGNIVIHRMNQKDMRELYKGHEIASHTLTHANLKGLDEETVYNEISTDIRNLEAFYEQKIAGFVFPFGTYDESAFRILKECGIQYARTPGETHGFALQSDLLRFKPSFHHADADIMSGIDRFLNMDTEEPQLLYIWGHSYEFDVDDNWEYMESILKKLAFHDDIFYGTNSQVLLQLFK